MVCGASGLNLLLATYSTPTAWLFLLYDEEQFSVSVDTDVLDDHPFDQMFRHNHQVLVVGMRVNEMVRDVRSLARLTVYPPNGSSGH